MLFCFGTQKSGTTWLQNILSELVPTNKFAEWQFPVLAHTVENHIESFCMEHTLRNSAEHEVLASAWAALLSQVKNCTSDKSAYPCLEECGRNDGLFRYAVDSVRHYFPAAKQVMIVRDPRDVLVSSKHFFSLSNQLNERFIEDFIDSWARCNLRWFASKPDLVIRYEDLKLQFESQVTNLASMLNIFLDDTALADICATYKTIEICQKEHPAFYRKGTIGQWKEIFTSSQNDNIFDCGMEAMNLFGYTKDGDVCSEFGLALEANNEELLRSYHSIPVGDLRCVYNTDVSVALKRENILEFFIFDDGFYLMPELNAPELEYGEKGLLLICMEWGEGARLQGEHCSLVLADQMSTAPSPETWWTIDTKCLKYTQAATVIFEIPEEAYVATKLNRGLCLRLFNGVQVPFTARITDIRFVNVRQSSHFATQFSDAAPTQQGPISDHVLAFYRSVGWSPLHFAAQFGSIEIVRDLLEAGLSPDLAEANGATALHRAADANRYDVAELLIARGATLNPSPDKGIETPLDLCVKKGHERLAELLKVLISTES
ncbi:MAG: ankyrin repeat domain-containing protein [Methylocystis sp.]